MAIPTRADAARLLIEQRPPARLLRHSTAVAEVAAFLAARAAARGVTVDRGLVETAALLHDVDKALPADHELRRLGHGHAGAAWLTERGHAELARAVAGHPVTRLADDEAYRAWLAEAALEERLVAYADKRALQRLVPMAARFAEWRQRYPRAKAANEKSQGRADQLEAEVCAAAGVAPDEVRRQRWVGRALATARSRRR